MTEKFVSNIGGCEKSVNETNKSPEVEDKTHQEVQRTEKP